MCIRDRLDTGADDTEQEPVGKHIAGVIPGVLRHANDQYTAEGANGGGHHPLHPGVQGGTEAFHTRLQLIEQQRQVGQQTEYTRLSPHLEIIVVGMNRIGAVEVGGIGLEDLLHYIGAQANAPRPVVLHQVPGSLIDAETVLNRTILSGVEDGEDAVVDGLGQEGDGGQTHQQEDRHPAPVQQGQEDQHCPGQADPTRCV